MSFLQVRLARDSLDTPWGFRMQGGKDLNQPLTVQRVFTNTPSEGELQRGDLIISINGRDTDVLTHKQAQDQIKYGGGQIDLFIKRPPPGRVHIQPLSPTKDTRAPTFPYSPTKAPQIQIPIRRRHSGPPSPTRIIPISPAKPSPKSPPKSPPKPAPKPGTDSSMAYTSGFKPTKITLNKYGGGGMDFGYSPKTPPAHATPAAHAYHPPSPPRQQYQPSPPQPSFMPQPQAQEEKGVEEEEYGGVHERRKKFVDRQAPPPDLDEDDYPTAPVWERRKLFFQKQNRPTEIRHARRPVPSYGRARGDDSPVFGSDYTKPQTYSTLPKAKKAPRPRPPAVNARKDIEEMDGPTPWSNTLRSERSMKPWEKEAMEHEAYQSATANEPYHPSQAPLTAPKPKITQIFTQSTARPQQQSAGPSAPPKQPVPIGQRDWGDSYVYQMVHQESKKSTTTDMPGHPGQSQTVTTTRVMDETRRPGEEPHRTVKETVTRSAPQQFPIAEQYGISDF